VGAQRLSNRLRQGPGWHGGRIPQIRWNGGSEVRGCTPRCSAQRGAGSSRPLHSSARSAAVALGFIMGGGGQAVLPAESFEQIAHQAL